MTNKHRTKQSIPYELLGFQRKIQSKKKIWMIIYEMFLNRNTNNLESVSISQLELNYKIRSETIWKYLWARISRKSLETNEKCIRLLPNDVKAIDDVLALSNRIASLSPMEAQITKFVLEYLINGKNA